jgi:hypothetical protein
MQRQSAGPKTLAPTPAEMMTRESPATPAAPNVHERRYSRKSLDAHVHGVANADHEDSA